MPRSGPVRASLAAAATLLAVVAQAEGPVATPGGPTPGGPVLDVPVPAPAGAPALTTVAPAPDVALPAMNFYSSVAADEVQAVIKSHPAFAKLDDELLGSPIRLRVTHTLQPTATGAATGFVSAILAGGTLGLIPAVTNNTLVVSYEILVHGDPVATFDYRRSLTRVVNLWVTDDPTSGLGKDGLEWLKGTASEFTQAAAADPAVSNLKREYEFYFATPAP